MAEINTILKDLKSKKREPNEDDFSRIREYLLGKEVQVENQIKGIAEFFGPKKHELTYSILINQMSLFEKYTTMFSAITLYKYSLHFNIQIDNTIGPERFQYLKSLALVHPSDDVSSELDRLMFYSRGLDEERYWENTGMSEWSRRRNKYDDFRRTVELIWEAYSSRQFIPEYFYEKLAERNTPKEIREFVDSFTDKEFVPEMNKRVLHFIKLKLDNDAYSTSVQ